MSDGAIKIAEHQDVVVIKFEGDVRLNLCLSFDKFIEKLFKENNTIAIVFDLVDAESIDSTTLGLMAKIAIKNSEEDRASPVVVSDNPSITRLLESMGFEEIFDIVATREIRLKNGVEFDANSTQEMVVLDQEERVKSKVIEAHQFLMSMNAKNHETFRSLIDALEEKNA